MVRVTIEVKEATRKRLKIQATKQGKTIKDYILWSVGLICCEKGVEK